MSAVAGEPRTIEIEESSQCNLEVVELHVRGAGWQTFRVETC